MTHADSPDPQDRELVSLRAEVADLRHTLGDDVWRLRRLAELGVAQAKLNHDLRNIMASALMVADRLETSEDSKVARAGRLIVAALEQATALINTSLDFANDGAPALARAPCPLGLLLDEVAQEVHVQHQTMAVEYRMAADVTIEADRALLLRAFGHLLRTAAKAQARRMEIMVEALAEKIVIHLSDDGRPFRDEQLANALRPFSGAFRFGSSGLGLVIARELIEAHGGTISVRHASGEATTCIEVTLPLSAPSGPIGSG
ncbi:MAG TPA: HAMP domain-containing sensor histidine kinase [Acidisoma sp.]|jgi:signal transduction histidine kinase|uniref:sensor histidine kinase n=1 Tax=Acidisoma sp. TaxID=1872115 RepID=UPI002CB5FF62|nr:HAMP domain-containing sensor histidine kinase [Acidisoma sp.]HTI02570.1 HAMP domain-containing sensor histidine kinase [Acidisoma sp.]